MLGGDLATSALLLFLLFASSAMAAPMEFTLDSVRDFMLDRGGKVTNHELVKHFKQFLTDPHTKGKKSFQTITKLSSPLC